jgi:hypothetical protein
MPPLLLLPLLRAPALQSCCLLLRQQRQAQMPAAGLVRRVVLLVGHRHETGTEKHNPWFVAEHVHCCWPPLCEGMAAMRWQNVSLVSGLLCIVAECKPCLWLAVHCYDCV